MTTGRRRFLIGPPPISKWLRYWFMSDRDLIKDATQNKNEGTLSDSHGDAELLPTGYFFRQYSWSLSLCARICLAFLLFVTMPMATLNASDTDTQGWSNGVDSRITINEPPSEILDASAEIKRISKYVQSLKTEVIELNNDLRLMEEQLLFPSGTRYSIFVSLSSGQFFTLESVKLVLNGKLVATHIYSDNQRQSMLRGGIHRMYVTNLNEGKHSATVFFTGIGPNGREYKRAANIDFVKGPVSKYLELAIGDDAVRQEPAFTIKQW